MSSNKSTPIELDFKQATNASPNTINPDHPRTVRTMDSYSYDRNILTPASPFRFTAPGIDKSLRTEIRSGDMVTIFAVDENGKKTQIGTGFIDETDTHITPEHIEYVLTGRDTLGQLVDNAAVDSANRLVSVKDITLRGLAQQIIANTRIPPGLITQQVPTGNLLFQTNPGETKINALQRYLEFTNCLVWSLPSGQMVLGKPNFTQDKQGTLAVTTAGITRQYTINNVVEARVRRNLNQAIRKIVTQVQTLDLVDAGMFTVKNQDQDMRARSAANVGRSVYTHFSYGQGNDAVNQNTQVGNQSGNPNVLGAALSLREIARDNMKILDVEVVVKDHINDNGVPYNIDQIYEVQIEDDDVYEDMYVYACSYELTKEHGMLTRMRLCRKGTICAYADALARQSKT